MNIREKATASGLATDLKKSIELAGKQGLKYVYNHYDAIFYMRTISYVVDYKDKYLGLEFRTDNQELDEIQKKILSSLKFR